MRVSGCIAIIVRKLTIPSKIGGNLMPKIGANGLITCMFKTKLECVRNLRVLR